MKKEILEQAVLDYIGEKFKDKVLDKRVQTFFIYSELVDAVLSFAELLNKNIEELEKENVELREKNNRLTKKCDCLTICNDELQDLLSNDIDTIEQLLEQRTKAKELLKEAQGYIENNDDVLYDEIEQFLEEIKENV